MIDKIFEGVEIPEVAKKTLTEKFETILKETEAQATVNANRILDKVGETFETDFEVPRLSTEKKLTDYLLRAAKSIGEKEKTKIQKEIELRDAKIKELESKGITDTTFKNEYETLKEKHARIATELEAERKRVAEIENGFNSKLNEYKIDNSIQSALPMFDPSVNKYELAAKKNETIQLLKEKYNLKFNDAGKFIAENKETYQTYEVGNLMGELLKDYTVKDNTTLPNAKPPINQPASKLKFTPDMDGKQKSELVESYLKAKGLTNRDSKWASEYQLAYMEASKQ